MPTANGTNEVTKKETEDLIRAILDILNSQIDKRAYKSLEQLLNLLMEHTENLSDEAGEYLAAMMATMDKDSSNVHIRTVAALKSVLTKELKKLNAK